MTNGIQSRAVKLAEKGQPARAGSSRLEPATGWYRLAGWFKLGGSAGSQKYQPADQPAG